jgi:hypothetical protein
MGNTNRSGARKRFLTGHHSLPQHFGAATTCSLNSLFGSFLVIGIPRFSLLRVRNTLI